MKRLGYLDGLATGLWLFAFAGAAALGAASPGFAEMYRSMNPAVIDGITKVVLSRPWYIGVPVLMLAAMIAALVWRPRYAVIAVAVVSLAVAVFWFIAAYNPLFALSGNIR
ncbi:MAG: hypothetical protein M4D80_14645 [Myxococcota bacterium]|nr:hypothetical protein [Myxococcota bacterium]